MEMPIDKIKTKNRIRRDMGDLSALSDSMKKHGQMNPIIINEKNELIAGERRLICARKLGWQTIKVVIMNEMNSVDSLEMEIEENTARKELTTDELAEAYIKLDKLKNPGFFQKLFAAIGRFFKRFWHFFFKPRNN